MPKKFEIGDKRFVVVKKDEVRIFEDGTKKMAPFTYPRWAQFVEYFNDITDNVAKLEQGQQDVKLKLHVGAGWYVSVTSGYPCVDIRKFYFRPGFGERPTRSGIALRLHEWSRLKEITGEIKEKNPKLAEAQPCWTGEDHYNQEGAIACRECNPFGTWASAD
jgi:hypothetical protein